VNGIWLATTAALGIVIGAIAVVRGGEGRLRAIDATVGFGAGFLLALVVLALVPEVLVAEGVRGAGAVLAGYLLVLLAQQFIAPHFHFGEERHPVSRVTAVSAVCALGLHGLFDGVGIGSGAAVAPSLGVLVFAGVALHKLPEGVTVTSLMLASGWGRGAVAAAVGLVAVATPLGALLARAAQSVASLGLGLAAGAALYVAASNLVPEMETRGRKVMVLTLLAGVGAFLGLQAALGDRG
jgi:ZIP family zinc transporter/zinc and cadmium transporter